MPVLTREGGGMPGPTEPTQVAPASGLAGTIDITRRSGNRSRIT